MRTVLKARCPPVIVDVDLGTTGFKAALHLTTGELISTQRWTLTTAHGSDGSAPRIQPTGSGVSAGWPAQQPPLVTWTSTAVR